MGIERARGADPLFHVDSREAQRRASLPSGTALRPGEKIKSANSQYRLVMQTDGNLVLYFAQRAIWNAGTQGNPGARLRMQRDGNAVVYAPNGGPALWNSRTAGHPGSTLAVQNDGNLVVYTANGGAALWATYSFNNRLEPGERLRAGQWLLSPNRAARLEMQADGNLVVYGGNRALWNAGTVGRPGAYVIMQPDGNLVVYPPSGPALWNSGTVGRPGARVNLQSDGNLVVYPPSGPALWATHQMVDRLRPGQALRADQFLVSESGGSQLRMQPDGNLVVYSGGRATWNAGTVGRAGAYVVMQPDGNLAVYPPSGAALWNSGTAGHSGAHAIMQSDTNLVVYQGTTALWSSNVPIPPRSGVIGDDYPEPWRSAPLDAYIDTWRYYSRECTSFVAWRLHSANRYEMPRAIGNAGGWGDWFRARGVAVNRTPARGAIAESSGHVAWVASVNANGTVTIEEYNVPRYSGRYSVRTVPANTFRYIHVRDL